MTNNGRIFGHRIYSEKNFSLPENGPLIDDISFVETPLSDQTPEMSLTSIIRFGVEATFGQHHDTAYLHWPGIGTFSSQLDGTIQYELEQKDIPEQKLMKILFSEVIGMHLCQKEYVLLHASAVVINGRAVMFAGEPGAGKSTTAAMFAREGYTILSDDLLVIDVSDEQISVLPGRPILELWPEAAEALKLPSSNYHQRFPGSSKLLFHPSGMSVPDQPIPVGDLYLLQTGSELQQSALPAPAVFKLFQQYFPCPHQLLQETLLTTHFHKSTILARELNGFRIQRPGSGFPVQHIQKIILP